jgi:hypothetical protein
MKISANKPPGRIIPVIAGLLFLGGSVEATPANRAALDKHYDRFLAKPLARCTTCHLPSEQKFPESLAEFPHNPFGDRLRKLGEELSAAREKHDLPTRLTRVAKEDSDGDGVPNETELLLGHNPGDPKDKPSSKELASAASRRAEFAAFLGSYRWQPFEPVVRPPIPKAVGRKAKSANPIDRFLAADWQAFGLKPRPEASKEILLRRVYLDLIGLNPTPEEQRAFLDDPAPEAYERLVDRLLDDPRHGERWARHWMDVWRYSDWAGWADGNQIRDSQRHIWRWRDWIVESLNADKPYDRMVTEMLAADELAPEDPQTLRATGFLVRNYKMLSREQWLEDTVKHTSQAFLGITVGCAKCHDHMVDPVSQREYYALRAVFEPHQVRTDRLPGELDIAKDGLVRAYDATNAPTFILVRGDERHPLTNEIIRPAVPASLGGKLEVHEVTLPWLAVNPDQREFVIQDSIAASEKSVGEGKAAWSKARSETNATSAGIREAELAVDLAEKKHAALLAVVAAERSAGGSAAPHTSLTDAIAEGSSAFQAATNAVFRQRAVAVAEAKLKQHQAQTILAGASTNKLEEAKKKLVETDQQFAAATEVLAQPLHAAFKPRPAETFPATSTGRRLAFAKWVTNPQNPLTARVAVNHMWLRHFGRGLVPTPADFGRNGRPPTNPQLLNWLAAEFMSPTSEVQRPKSGNQTPRGADFGPRTLDLRPWSFRHLHRLIVTSAAYRMASTSDEADLTADPDNFHLWRMNSRRLEAEAVRDNLLHVAGTLDLTRGGPDIDQKLALTSPRRSIYLRHAAEKQAEFLQIFDGPSVTECYERRPSVMPQQALALGNSELALKQARVLAARLVQESAGNDVRLVELAFQRILSRRPTAAERQSCVEFFGPAPVSAELAEQAFAHAAENLVLVLFNHNDFVTVR